MTFARSAAAWLLFLALPARGEWCLNCSACARHAGGEATRCGYADRSACSDACSRLERGMNLESGACSCSGGDSGGAAAGLTLPPLGTDPGLMMMGIMLQGEQAGGAAKARSAQELRNNTPEMNRQAAERAAEAERDRDSRGLTHLHRARAKARVIKAKMLPPRPGKPAAPAARPQAAGTGRRPCPDDPERAYGRQVAVRVDELERLGGLRTPAQTDSLNRFSAELRDLRSREAACAPPPTLAPAAAPAAAAPLDAVHRHLYEEQRRTLWGLLREADAEGRVAPADKDACLLRPPLAPDFNRADSAGWSRFEERRREWETACLKRREPPLAAAGEPPSAGPRPAPLDCAVCTGNLERDARGTLELPVVNAALDAWRACLADCGAGR